MQPEKTVEVNNAIGPAALGLRNRDAGAQPVVIGLGEGNDDVQAVSRSALKKDDELFFVGRRCRGDRALEKRGHGAEADQGDAPLFEKVAARELEVADALAAAAGGGV